MNKIDTIQLPDGMSVSTYIGTGSTPTSTINPGNTVPHYTTTTTYNHWNTSIFGILRTNHEVDKKCNCCKKTKTGIFMYYTGKKITRYICEDCAVKKFDKLFGIKTKELEDVLFD